MERVDFFQGTREHPPLILSFYDGRVELECTISEAWGALMVHTLKCGAKYVRKLKRSVGIVFTEKDDLDAFVSSSLGLKGIASLEAQISSKTGVELQLSRSEEIENEFTFEAPSCGEKVIVLYQFRRTITLKFRDNRPFRRKKWVMTMTCWTDQFYDETFVNPNIPECGCRFKEPNPDSGRLDIYLGNITMTTEFLDGKHLKIPSLDLEVDKSTLDQTVQFPKTKLPDYLQFLAGDLPDMLEARFSVRNTGENGPKTKKSEDPARVSYSGARARRLTHQERQSLFDLANAARQRAYAPYSNNPVGAALRTKSGRIFTGVNVENAAYPSSVCAECVAVFKAVSEGELEFDVIVVVSDQANFPCGSCRQVLAEFGPDTLVLAGDGDGTIRKEATVGELLPGAFSFQPVESD